jgi:hypothetical protein
MALSAAERKRQEQLKKKAEADKRRRQANRNETRNAAVKESDKKAAQERKRIDKKAEVAQIWGGGEAAKRKAENDRRYAERVRTERNAQINRNWDANDKRDGARPTPRPTAAAPRPATSSRPTSRFAGARDANLNRINNDPRFAAPTPQPLRSPAIGAPVHASPAAFGSAPKLAQSAYVGSSAASPARPSTPGQAVIQQAANPFQGIGDIRGQQLPQAPVQQDAELSAGAQQYGGQQLQGIDQNGIDMERRRAFLDADNSLAGLKAVKELLNRRKLSISVES